LIPIRNLTELRALRQRLVSLRNLGAVVAPRVAAQFSALGRADFEARRSPSGAAWKANKRTGKVPTLHRSGTLEAAATAFRAFGHTVRASVARVAYARYQQPSRFVPSKKLSPARQAVIESIAEEEIRRALGGGR
jgi:hypothetical protein